MLFAVDPGQTGILTASIQRGHVVGTSDDSTGETAYVRDMSTPAVSERNCLHTNAFRTIAGCGTSTRGECRPAAGRSIRRTPQQQVQSSHRLAYVSGTCRQRPWSQFADTDRPIELPVYDGRITPKTWGPQRHPAHATFTSSRTDSDVQRSTPVTTTDTDTDATAPQLTPKLGLGGLIFFGVSYMSITIGLLVFGILADTSHNTTATAFLIATVAMLLHRAQLRRAGQALPPHRARCTPTPVNCWAGTWASWPAGRCCSTICFYRWSPTSLPRST